MVSEVAAKLAGARAVSVAEYRGLTVEGATRLRARARKSGLYLRVLKNPLARRAVQGTPFEKLTEQMSGPLMYGITRDPVAGAKVLADFARETERFVIKAGAARAKAGQGGRLQGRRGCGGQEAHRRRREG